MTGPTAVAPVSRWVKAGAGEQLQRGDEDLVAGEVPVALTYNRRAHVVMMATPLDLEDFALGFSFTEGIIQHPDQLHAVRVIPREQGLELALSIDEDRAELLAGRRRNLTGRTGCGLCGAESLEQAVRQPPALAHTLTLAHGAIEQAVQSLSAQQPLQAATGAVHCAAWCSPSGEIRLAREDVGRHNALDKLSGAMLNGADINASRSDIRSPGGFLLVSSRASYEMVLKSAAMGIELMAAVSAPTSLAIELANDCGLTLLGFTRSGRHNVYTHAGRLTS